MRDRDRPRPGLYHAALTVALWLVLAWATIVDVSGEQLRRSGAPHRDGPWIVVAVCLAGLACSARR